MRAEDGLQDNDLHAQMTAMLGRKTPWLSFPAALEERFEDDRRESRNRHLRGGVLVALIIYDLFLFCDFHFLPQHFVRCLIIRLAIVTPITLGSYVLLCFNPPKRVRESLIVGVSCVVCFCTLYIWHDVNAVASAFAETALILLILFVNTIMRLSVWHALISTMVGIVNGAIFLRWDPWLAASEKTTMRGLVLTGVVFSLVANYWMEREERIGYLLRMQLEARGRELSSANHELTRLSNVDALTGLANRRYFSRSFESAWDAAVLAQEAISVLLIDIDHFKKINDEFGHLYGDETLLQLGRILREGLRKEEGMAARFGGEEFVVLLPGIAFDRALIVAERLRRLTRTIRLPMRDGVAPAPTTISIGVSTAWPMSHDQAEQLLRAADAALYAAKGQGRDRIWPPLEDAPAFQDNEFELMFEQLSHVEVRELCENPL